MEDVVCPGRLDGLVTLVTGSTHGIGRGIARRFAREGAAVVINDEGAFDGERVAADIREETNVDDVMYVEADVRDPAAIQQLIERTVDEFGGLDILVNNVGEGRNGHPGDVTIDDWDFVMETSLRSGWLCVKHALEYLAGGGSVINISSIHASETTTGYFPYNVAKAGLNGLTRALAVELADVDIRVNAISPGRIVIGEDRPDEDALRSDSEFDPVGRSGAPRDIAGLAAYLASVDATYLTGSIFDADGGRNAVQSVPPDGR